MGLIMKKFFAILAAIVAATSCQHYEETDILPTTGADYSIEVGIDDATRTYFESLGTTYRHYWEADDALSVLTLSGDNHRFALTGGADTRQSVFSGTSAIATAPKIYAVYPYNADNRLVGTTLEVVYPDAQTARTDRSSYDREAHLMTGYGSGDGTMQLRNISSYLKITLTGEATVRRIKVRSIGGEPLAGAASVAFKGDEPEIVLEGDTGIVKLECSVALTQTVTDFYIAVAPSTLAHGFAVTVEDGNGMSMTRTHSKAVEFRRNTVYEMPAFAYTATDKVLEADLLDIVFNTDGTAKDISPMDIPVTTYPSSAMTTYFDEIQGCNVARFNHAIGTTVTEGYYKADYSQNEEFKRRLRDGFSMECLFMMASAQSTGEDKMFSGHESAGFGMIISKKANGSDICFLPNINTDGTGTSAYKYANSRVVPEPGKYYHAVGVWDKVEGKIHIYVDGKLCGTTDVPNGELVLRDNKPSVQTVFIGGDTSVDKCQGAWNGEVLIARIYDAALGADDIATLYDRAKRDRSGIGFPLQGISHADAADVSAGYKFPVRGYGFAEGDTAILRSGGTEYRCETAVYSDSAVLTIPAELTSGTYEIVFVRDSAETSAGSVVLTMHDTPKADMLDVVFRNDGTATDASAMQLPIQTFASNFLTTYYDNCQGCYSARFSHPLGANISGGFYKANYLNNPAFKAELADGYTLETLFMLADDHDGTAEIKPFASHHAAGTGFLVGKTARNKEIIFLPNINTKGTTASNYIYTMSGIVPQKGVYYHVIGVWDKAEGKTHIYVNGELCGTEPAAGEMIFPTDDLAWWFGIGGDAKASATASQNAWNGDVAIARIYDKPLTADDVARLWNATKRDRPVPTVSLTDKQYLSGVEVGDGTRYAVYADGFRSGDTLRFESTTGGKTYDLATEIVSDRAVATIPSDFTTDTYRIVVVRGSEVCPIGTAELTFKSNPREIFAPQIIAHRGVRTNGEPDNSLAALAATQKVDDIYGIEFDIFITKDDVIVLNHDKTTSNNGYKIEDSTFATVRTETLSNGEPLPTLEEWLAQAQSTPELVMVVEVKRHSNAARALACAQAAVNMIKAKGMENRAAFISFDYEVCKLVGKELPDVPVGYTSNSSDKTPKQVSDDGVNAINYLWSSLSSMNGYIESAHALGMDVLTWTVSDAASILDCMAAGVDRIITNDVHIAKSVTSKRFVEHR